MTRMIKENFFIKCDHKIMHLAPMILFLVLSSCSASSSVNSDKSEGNNNQNFDKYTFVVSKDGSGDFTSIQKAIDSLKSYQNERQYVYIKDGVYKENLVIPAEKTNITLIGESKKGAIITYYNAARKINPETGEEYGTFGSASVYVHAVGFVAANITFRNSAGYYGGIKGRENQGQALAISVDGDKSIFKNCRFLSGQDTFYAEEVRSYVVDSYIEGTTDFIFGSATVVFDHCEIHSYGGSAITAANTPKYIMFGFVFRDCNITAEPGVKTLLGRAWRDYAATAFLNTNMENCIKPEGWSNWGEPDRKQTARYVEYSNSGPGADTSGRVEWAHILTESGQASKYKTLNVLKTTYDETPQIDNWNPKKILQKIDKYIRGL